MSSTPANERILLFIPMYNCEPQIPRVIAQLTPRVQELLAEVIVVDNRSKDQGQAAAIRALQALGGSLPSKVLFNEDNYGLGGSHKVAFNYAIENGFDYVAVLHGEAQGNISDLVPSILAREHREVDYLLGARFLPESRLTGYSTVRTLGNHFFNLVYSAVAGRRIHDLGPGLNLYSVPALEDKSYLRHANDLTFNDHMILHAVAAKKSIRFFPLEWREEDQLSSIKIFRQTLLLSNIAKEYALNKKRYLEADYSNCPGATYSSTVVFDSTQSGRNAADPRGPSALRS